MNDIMVSICCTTYNHENYISAALEGFISQVTDFRFEVIVHDDASTDNTASIIRKFHNKYPNLIKPVFQEKNQWSEGIRVFQTYIYPKVKGKYIAMCEGDDYWIDPKKLQKQVDYMESHPKCTFCFTNGWVENVADGNKRRIFAPYTDEDVIHFKNQNQSFTLQNTFKMSFVPTASFLFPANNIQKMPGAYHLSCPAGDLKMRLFFTALGYSYFLNDLTCIYRQNVPNSILSKWHREDRKKVFIRSENIARMIEAVDDFSDHEYTDALNKIKDIHVRAMLNNASSLTVLKDTDCSRVYEEYSMKTKFKVLLKIFLSDTIVQLIKKRK